MIKLKINRELLLFSGIIVTITVFIILRIIYLNSDPPANLLSGQGVYQSDEGYWCHNARNYVLFGKFIQDGFNPIFTVPIYSLLQTLNFKIFGFSLHQARLFNGFFSILTLLLLIIWLNKYYSQKAVFILSILLCGNFIYTIYCRMALVETLLIFSFSFIVFIVDNERKVLIFIKGLLTGIIYYIKPTALPFVFLIFIFHILSNHYTKNIPIKDCIRDFWKSQKIFFITSIFIILTVQLYQRIYFSEFVNTNENHYITSILNETFKNLNPIFLFTKYFNYMSYQFFSMMPVLLYFSLLSIMQNIIKPTTKLPFYLSLYWFLGYFIFFGFFTYHSYRYSTLLIIPMTILTTHFLCESQYHVDYSNNKKTTLLFLIESVIVLYIISNLIQSYTSWKGGLILVLILTHNILYLFSIFQNNLNYRYLLKSLTYSVIILFIMQNSVYYYKWLNNLDYSIYHYSKKIGELLPKDSTIIGNLAPQLGFENNIRIIAFVPNFLENLDSIVNHYNPKYIIAQEGHKGSSILDITSTCPQYFQVFTPIYRAPLINNYYTGNPTILYKIP